MSGWGVPSAVRLLLRCRQLSPTRPSTRSSCPSRRISRCPTCGRRTIIFSTPSSAGDRLISSSPAFSSLVVRCRPTTAIASPGSTRILSLARDCGARRTPTPGPLVDDRAIDERFESPPQAVRIRRHTLPHQHGDQLAARIDREDCPGGAVPPVLTGVHRHVDVAEPPPARSAARLAARRQAGCSPSSSRQSCGKDAAAVQLAAIEQHLAEAKKVRHGRDEADGAFEQRRPSVNGASGSISIGSNPPTVAVRYTVARRPRWSAADPESGVVHAERLEHALVEEHIERLAGPDLDKPSRAPSSPRCIETGCRDLPSAARERFW